MRPLTGLNPLLLSGALVTIAASPGMAATASITDIQLKPTDDGLNLVFAMSGDDTSNMFTVSQGNTLQADLTRTQLNLPDGAEFHQANPAPGIASVSVIPLDANSVRVTIDGISQAPSGQLQTAGGNVVLAVQTTGSPTPAATVPTDIETVPGNDPGVIAQGDTEPPPTAAPDPDTIVPPTQETPDVLVPNPTVTIDGTPVAQPRRQQAPPFLPRAVAPPVGDISISESGINSYVVDLGSNERIPKLVLRDAPSREVLALLARAAGLNLIFTENTATSGGGTGGEGGNTGGPPVTLDIENESVQEVFNNVLRVTGLQANRVGRSIYVGANLPDGARSLVSRTVRLNQASASDAAGYLASLGAVATRTVTKPTIEQVTTPTSVEGAQPIINTVQTEETTVEELTYDPAEGSPVARPLAGLQAVADSRLNSVTVVGEANLVALATEYLTRLDLRRRQVAVNVKIIDYNLGAAENLGVSFSYLNNGLSFGFGANGLTLGVNTNDSSPSAQQFIINLQAAINNDNAKILTDPTLVIQEGQTASVALVQQVLTSVTTTVSPDTGVVTSITPEFQDAGLILSVQVERIDDNGFVTFSVSPTVSSPQPPIDFVSGTGDIQQLTPVQRREVSSGSIRVRDGQTLVLAGIIQESEQSSVTKVPILGDLPIIGALFRSTNNSNTRNEVIVLLTPQILDDSDQSAFGYSYTPSEEVQNILDNRPE